MYLELQAYIRIDAFRDTVNAIRVGSHVVRLIDHRATSTADLCNSE